MHIAVIGAGVTGVTTAYYLAQKGAEVSLFDSANEAGMGASFGNGAQLSYSFADPMARPAMLRALLPMLMGRDRAMNIHLSAALIPWGMRFLRECTPVRTQRNLYAALSITDESSKLLEPLLQHTLVDCSHHVAGKLVLLSSPVALRQAEAVCKIKRELGFDTQTISLKEATEIEPAISNMTDNYCGAVYSRYDAVGDAHQFCQSLGDWLTHNTSTTLRLSTAVQALKKDSRSPGVVVNAETEHFDAVVVCAGNSSAQLVKPLGVNLPIYPVRGYSLTLPLKRQSPHVSITLASRRLVLSRLDTSLRIAGFADFTTDHQLDKARGQALLETARSAAPEAADFDSNDIKTWSGNRPMTPNSLPYVGATQVAGLYLNTGHGMLGWTMACGTAHRVANSIFSS
ncbi:MAG: FAD-dependent oxidoreductase [Gammaproteobacteria bacterium]